MSYIARAFGVVFMEGRVLTIAIIVTFVVIGGAVAYGAQNNTNTILSSYGDTSAHSLHTPQATTLDVSETGASAVIFRGVVGSDGDEVSYWFEYSGDPLLGQVLIHRTPRVVLITSAPAFPVEIRVRGLINRSTYYVRLVVTDGTSIVRGNRVAFYIK